MISVIGHTVSEAAEQMLEDYLAGRYRREKENEKCYAKNGGE